MALSEQEQFIRQHLSQFGLTGSNTQHNAESGFPCNPSVAGWEHSKNSHYQFGYNGQKFNWRRSSSCMYWTRYGTISRKPQSFREELIMTLKELFARFGPLALFKPTKPIEAAVLVAARLAEVDFELISISPYLTQSEQKIREFCQAVRCNNPHLALLTAISKEVWEGEAQRHVILPAQLPTLVDQNYDEHQQSFVGPPYWTLVDYEEQTTPLRFASLNQYQVSAEIFKYSPELIAAYLLHPMVKSRLLAKEPLARQAPAAIENEFLLEQFPELQGLEAQNDNTESPDWSRLRAELTRDYSKCNEPWLTPLHRFISQLGIEASFPPNFSPTEYGVVFAKQN